jgi:hypothetical protein
MPVTSILYNATAALYSQARLALGKYLDKFDVTEKATRSSIDLHKSKRKTDKSKATSSKAK